MRQQRNVSHIEPAELSGFNTAIRSAAGMGQNIQLTSNQANVVLFVFYIPYVVILV